MIKIRRPDPNVLGSVKLDAGKPPRLATCAFCGWEQRFESNAKGLAGLDNHLEQCGKNPHRKMNS